jgi:hypothetical protein
LSVANIRVDEHWPTKERISGSGCPLTRGTAAESVPVTVLFRGKALIVVLKILQ